MSLYPINAVEVKKLHNLVLDHYAEATKDGKQYVPLTESEITALVEKATGRKAWSPK